MNAPEPVVPHHVLAPVRAVLEFQASGELDRLEDVFTPDAVIVDSFAPFVFDDHSVWARAFLQHIGSHASLAATLLTPQEFSMSDDAAYVSQPVQWTFTEQGRDVVELGGLAAVVRRVESGWRISNLSWAVTSMSAGPLESLEIPDNTDRKSVPSFEANGL